MSYRLKIQNILLLLCCFAVPRIIQAQPESFINGKIINSKTNQAIPFATIKLKNTQIGVYANADGDFRIIRNGEFKDDSVIVTCIGFIRNSVAFNDLDSARVNKISLAPVIYGIREVKVIASAKKLGSLAIVRRAIRNIQYNYPQQPFNYISYYRDYQKRDGNYINLNEAIVQVLDDGFNSRSIVNKYRLLDFKKNTDFPRLNITPYYATAEQKNNNNNFKSIPAANLGDQYGNELFVLMVHDAIRNFNTRSFSFIEIFSEDFITNHNFSPPVPVYNNNLLLYKIIFNGKTKIIGDSFQISGAIFIQPKTYSIHKIEYSCSYKQTGKGLGEMFNVDIEYGHQNSTDSLMYLKYISFNNFFQVIDTDDDTYFRVLKAYVDTQHYIDPTLVVEFNNEIDPVTSVKKENYEISFGNYKPKISNIQAGKKSVFIRIKKEEIKNPADSCKIAIADVKNLSGNILNVRKKIDLYQFRELFVEEYNNSLQFSNSMSLNDSCYIKYLPLEENCRSFYTGNEKYWMNTPINEEKPHDPTEPALN